jgi:Tol biopolymer transport system component/tRNA A-37 threonylcarbamoyl transferase component Bud32
MLGRKLAHYTITGKLGEGGMGVVYEAQDGHLDRAVALKVLPHDALANPARKQRFVQEAKAASALNHPHIVTIHDIDSEGGVDFIAMELIRGRTLEQVLSRGKLRLADALKYGVQIADALAAAHAAGIVHRDLKPGNVMITERGDVKVLDFGLAKLSDDTDLSEDDATRTQRAVTEEGSVVGSAPYMSPEQAEGRKVDARSDIFSFGSLLYEMLTGKRAFRGANRTATMAAILKDEPEPPTKSVPDLPREVERVVSRCLRKDLDRRSQSMAEIRVALQDLKEESESGSLVAPASAAARQKTRWPYYFAGGVLLAVAVAAAWIFGSRRPAAPLHATVLTSFVGLHYGPSLSPDGNQFAFAWTGDVPKGPPHIFISLVGKGTPLRLTPENEAAVYPSWSPDGQSIAFWRFPTGDGSGELSLIPSLGGPSRRLSTIGSRGYFSSVWSPDAKWLVWSKAESIARASIYIAPAGGGEAYQLLASPAIGGDFFPAFAPDGRALVWCRCPDAKDCDLYLSGFQEGRLTGAPRQLTHDHEEKGSPLWTHDGKEIIYIAGDNTSEVSINRVGVSGGEPQRIEGIGANASNLTLAAKSNRLLYSTFSTNYDIRRVDLTAADAKPERFLASTRYEVSPAYSPDGKRIAFSSNRGGVRQIWVADADGANPAPLTSFPSGLAGSPKWSPDGQFIVFDGRPETNTDIYTVPATGGPVKRLTDNPAQDHIPTWSPDGKWIYFGSTRAGGHEVFRMKPDGSGVQQMTHDGGIYSVVAPDGKWIYYSVQNKGVWKMPVDGGQATQVLPRESLAGFYFVINQRGLYALSRGRPSEGYPAVFYPSDGGKPRTLTTLSRLPAMFPEVSPDGRWFLYTAADDPVYEIMLVENFR